MAGFRNNEKKALDVINVQVGGLMDVPTASMITGEYNDTIMNGGVTTLNGVFGTANSFKTALAEYCALSATNRISLTHKSEGDTYDTEVNKSIARFNLMASKHKYLDNDITNSQWFITNKALMTGDEWLVEKNKHIKSRVGDKNEIITYRGFIDPTTNKPRTAPIINQTVIDSWTHFSSKKVDDIIVKGMTGDGSDTTANMKKGLFKDNALGEMTSMCANGNNYFFLTAHSRGVIDMRTGPAARSALRKNLVGLKADEDIKGVGANFFYLLLSLWKTSTAVIQMDADRTGTLYPTKKFNLKEDLKRVKVEQMRGKNGMSNYILELLFSQTEGFLPSLTEFDYCKRHSFGFSKDSNARFYSLAIKPDIKLQRTTVRDKLTEDPELTRAMNITSEFLQMKQHFGSLLGIKGYDCTIQELYDDLIKLGYDWKVLLNTRGWYTPDHYKPGIIPCISILDFFRMRTGEYVPYWMDEPGKIKKEYKSYFVDNKIIEG